MESDTVLKKREKTQINNIKNKIVDIIMMQILEVILKLKIENIKWTFMKNRKYRKPK